MTNVLTVAASLLMIAVVAALVTLSATRSVWNTAVTPTITTKTPKTIMRSIGFGTLGRAPKGRRGDATSMTVVVMCRNVRCGAGTRHKPMVPVRAGPAGYSGR